MRPCQGIVGKLILAAGLAALVQASAQAAPRAELWPRWQAHDPNSQLAVDHTPWQGFLDRFIARRLAREKTFGDGGYDWSLNDAP